MFNYLYYKLYRANLTGSLRDIPQYITPIYFGLAISANIMLINAFLAKIDIGHFLFTDPKEGGLLTLIIIILSALYFNKKKQEIILSKYSTESEKERKKGNAIIAVYGIPLGNPFIVMKRIM